MSKQKPSKRRRPKFKSKPKKAQKPPLSARRHSKDLGEGTLQKPLGENPYRRRARTHGRSPGTHGRTKTRRRRSRGSRSREPRGSRHSRTKGKRGRSGGRTSRRRRKKMRKQKKKPKGVTKYAWKKELKERRERKKKHYSRYRWYWGMISQAEAETHLKDIAKPQDGTFLVRSQMYQKLTRLVITILTIEGKETKIHHLVLHTRGPNWQLENCPSRHKTVVELVRYYRYHRIGLTGMRLKHTVRQPEWMLRSYHILAPRKAKVLGSGNFSQVIIGAYCRRLVAIKKLTSSGDQLMKDREALMKEALFMVKLNHPYITKLIGISVDKLPPMLLLEFMADPLDSHLKKHGEATRFEEKMLYCLQLAKGMAHMAKLQIVHRDLAARNALFSRYGILKIADFGLSERELDVCMINMVREKLPCAWMAPESLADLSCSTFSEKTDVWGFAVTCFEIFENGKKPLEHVHEKMAERLVKEGNKLHVQPKNIPREVLDFLFERCMNRNPSLRPPFEEIRVRFDLWIKLKYFPPPLEKRTVCKIKHCTPLTMAEYEILFVNNLDWLPEVRRGHHKKKWKQKKKKRSGKKRKRLAKIAKLKKKNPRKVLRKLRRRLRMRRKRMKMKKKLRIMRRLRTEEKTRIRMGRENAEAYKKQRYYSRHRCGRKRIRQKFQKLVTLYKRLMHVKFRKRVPNRPNRKRLRRTRRINKKSKHPASRNGKAIRVMSRKIRLKRAKYPKPKFPNIKKFAKRPLRVKKPKKAKKTKMDPRFKRIQRLKRIRDRKVRRMLAVKTAMLNVKQKKHTPKAKLSVDPKAVRKKKWLKKKRQKKWKKLMKKKKRRKKKKKLKRRKMKKRKRRRKRKRVKKHKRRRHRMRNRRRHRKWRRVRRRRKKRQRIREKHQRKCIRALTIAQRERWLNLSKRRRERMRMMHRRKRRTKIARILKRWRLMRRIMWKKRLRQMTRRKNRLAERLKKRRERRKRKKLRKIKKLERKKRMLQKKLARKKKKRDKKMKRKKKKEKRERKEKEKNKKDKSKTTTPGPKTLARRAARKKRKEERKKRKEEHKKRKLEKHAKRQEKKAAKKEKRAARRHTSTVTRTRKRTKKH